MVVEIEYEMEEMKTVQVVVGEDFGFCFREQKRKKNKEQRKKKEEKIKGSMLK